MAHTSIAGRVLPAARPPRGRAWRCAVVVLVTLALAGCATPRTSKSSSAAGLPHATTTPSGTGRSSLLGAAPTSSSSAATATPAPESEPVHVAPPTTLPPIPPAPHTTVAPVPVAPAPSPCAVAVAYIAAHGAPGWSTVCGYHAGYDVPGCVAAAQTLGGRLPYGCTNPITHTTYIACPIFVVYANEAENQRYASGLGGRLDAFGEAPQCAYANPLGN
jgi:hypothetical protein